MNSLDLWDRNFGGSPTKQAEFIANSLRPSTTGGRIFKMPTPKYLEGKPEAAKAALSLSMSGMSGMVGGGMASPAAAATKMGKHFF